MKIENQKRDSMEIKELLHQWSIFI